MADKISKRKNLLFRSRYEITWPCYFFYNGLAVGRSRVMAGQLFLGNHALDFTPKNS
ncbi:MAG: hypothetical protein M0P70_13795 [Desulfobulbaceae bacterium]|nr:hypothetical protein [Desulfobulbaceae bacterium]